MVFSKGDVAIGENGIAVFYYNDDGEWVSQEFDDDNGNLERFAKIVSSACCVRFSMIPENGVQLSFVSDKISSGNLPTYLYPRIEKTMSDEEFERRVSEYGPPKNVNGKAMEIISEIDPTDEVSVKEGLVKWIIALTISDDNVFDFAKTRNWVSLRKAAEEFRDKYGSFSELELTPPLDGNGFGFAEFKFSADNEAVFELQNDALEGFRNLISKSCGVILETARENGMVFVNLVFSV